MNFDNLFKMINARKVELNSVLNTENKEVLFFDEVITNNNFSSISGLLNLDCEKVMTAYLVAISNGLGCDRVYEIIKKNSFLVASGFDDEIKKNIFSLLDLLENDTLMFKKKINKMVNNLKLDCVDFESIRELFRFYGDNDLMKIIALINSVNELKKDYVSKSCEFDDLKNDEFKGIRISKNKKEQLVKGYLEYGYNIEKISLDLSIINSYYDKIRSYDKTLRRDTRKNIVNYDKLVKILNDLTLEKTLNKTIINNIVDLIDDENILKEFLYQLNIEQNKYFKELSDEYLKLSSDSKVSISALFKNYGIDFNNFSNELKDKMLKLGKENLEEFLILIKNLGITSYDMICYVLENSNSLVISNFINWIKDGIFTLDFILDNREFLSINVGVNNYTSLVKRLDLFRNENINCRLFINDLSVYLIPIDRLTFNINVLSQYKLLFGFNKISSFSLLKDDNLEEKIDLFLELGYESLLEEDISYLNVDIAKVRKLYILKGMNLLPLDRYSLINVLNNKGFLDCISDIDSYVFNIVSYKIDNKLLLGKKIDYSKYFTFDDNDRVMNVNGVLLSCNRIKRNELMLEGVDLSISDKIIYSLVYGSILSEEEYGLVASSVDEAIKKSKS